VKVRVAAKPELVQISTAYKQQSEGEKTIPRNKYVENCEENPDTPEKAKWPEFKTCEYTTRGHRVGRHREGRAAEGLHRAYPRFVRSYQVALDPLRQNKTVNY
jgi:hypothetical protein